MRIVITGADGQLGRALQEELTGEEVFGFGHATLDVTDPAAVNRTIAEARPSLVVHAAAWTDTAACESDPERAMAVNAEGARNVAAACSDVAAAMVYVSTNEVFDGEKSAPYLEDDRTNPINAYGRSKLAGEDAVRETLADHLIVRTSWLYGPGRASFPEKILAAAREKGRLRLVTDEVASPTWTVDLARAIALLIDTGASGVYHLANASQCSRKEWAEEVLRLAGISVPIEETTQAEFSLPYRKPAMSALANTRAEALGVTLRPWQEALADHMAATGQTASKSGARA